MAACEVTSFIHAALTGRARTGERWDGPGVGDSDGDGLRAMANIERPLAP
jgi:hypothetical protein